MKSLAQNIQKENSSLNTVLLFIIDLFFNFYFLIPLPFSALPQGVQWF